MDKTYAGMSYEEVVEKYSDYITRMCVDITIVAL